MFSALPRDPHCLVQCDQQEAELDIPVIMENTISSACASQRYAYFPLYTLPERCGTIEVPTKVNIPKEGGPRCDLTYKEDN
jgi:hypothetical protein